ncbi:class I SAM-dependent methyltransferase [Leptospira ilyithenensis]|nr:class I SAM-dependent methyltransferase [Leptospira ilyithenensis]
MSDLVYKRKICRLCNSPDLVLALPLKASALADEFLPKEMLHKEQPTYPLDLFLCKKCGFSQLVDIVIPKAIYIDYMYETVSSLGLVEHFKRYAKEIVTELSLGKDDLVVDIGSNDGSLLRAFKSNGTKVLGVDPAREIAKKATESGIETLPDFFTLELAQKITQSHGKANVITANNIYANVDELEPLTLAIRELLADDGVFVFESFYTLEWIKNMVFDFMYHEHLSYFSVKPVQEFFDRLGMELVDVWPIPTKGGSIRCFIQKKNGKRKIKPSVEKYIADEKAFKLHDLETYKKFENEINIRKQAVLDYINPLLASGKTIAGFGASATTTTLMYHFELEGKITFIADDYKVKQNTFSPGHHIPVLPPEAIYEKNPDYIFIFAWRYTDPIVAKHQKFLDQGGKFIVPLPNLKIIEK